MNEQEIIERIKNGEQQLFEDIYISHKNKAMQLAYLMTGNQTMAKDITQEAFVECYISIKKLKEPAYFATWFYKILTRTAWRYIKQEKKFVHVEEIETMKDTDTQINDPYMQSEMSNFIISEINKMDYKKRTTLILYYYNELSIKEIAKVMGCYTGTVKSRLNSGRRELKKYLLQEEYLGIGEAEKSYEMATEYR